MNIIGKKIYPDSDADGIEYEPDEWELGDGHFIRHVPTFCIFEIGCDEEALRSGNATLLNFFARLVHVCDGKYEADEGMDDETLNFLGRGAIAVYLQAIGAWKPEVINCPDRPEHEKIRSKYPKLN